MPTPWSLTVRTNPLCFPLGSEVFKSHVPEKIVVTGNTIFVALETPRRVTCTSFSSVVNFMALESKLWITRLISLSSCTIQSSTDLISMETVTRFSLAKASCIRRMPDIILWMSMFFMHGRTKPACSLLKSRTSLMVSARFSAPAWIEDMWSSTLAFAVLDVGQGWHCSPRSFEKPKIAFAGVRNSWAMVATKFWSMLEFRRNNSMSLTASEITCKVINWSSFRVPGCRSMTDIVPTARPLMTIGYPAKNRTFGSPMT
mmetsp:Transcript_14559/g.29451  ORF Transcript_14559/g.29451 Transcript_14559/m.29451 type:complete len:258 (-) Transcript_14559:454-1227(-)